jgi:Raf kinase inhibitor-like YbhB/YbcL family protein
MRSIICIILLGLILTACGSNTPAPQATVQPGSTEIPSAATLAPTQAGQTAVIAPIQTVDPTLAMPTEAPAPTLTQAPMEGNMKISTSAFADGQPIPAVYTCSGDNISPALTFEGVPGTAKSLALIMDDPDAPGGIWVHWVLYNIPVSLTGLPEKVSTTAKVSGIGTQGLTSFGSPGYGGPCPPAGKAHHYYFKLYALDLDATMAGGLNKAGLLKQMEGHILAQAEWIGTFQR